MSNFCPKCHQHFAVHNDDGSCVDDNIRPCEICGADTSFERHRKDLPHEGELCCHCDRWVCIDCVDWQRMDVLETVEIMCKECS